MTEGFREIGNPGSGPVADTLDRDLANHAVLFLYDHMFMRSCAHMFI